MASVTFWGLTASPYQLKMQALADYSAVPWQRLPEQVSSPRAIVTLLRLRFDRGEALYEGSLMGSPFRSVVKTFQVVTWRELDEQWQALDHDARQELSAKFQVLSI